MTATFLKPRPLRNSFLNNFHFKVCELRQFFLINCFLQVGGALIATIVTLLTLRDNKLYDLATEAARAAGTDAHISVSDYYWLNSGGGYFAVGIGMFAMGLVCALPLAMGSFDYLYRKSRVDMILALPVSTGERFRSDFSAGLVMYIFPTVVAAMLSLLLFGVCGPSVITAELGGWQGALEALGSGAVCVLIGEIWLYGVLVLGLTCCGSAREAVFSFIGILVAPSAVILVLYSMYQSFGSYGMNDSENLLIFLESFAGPVGVGVKLLDLLDKADISDSGILHIDGGSLLFWVLVSLVLISLMVLVSWLLYRHRKAEDTAKPFVYRWLYYVIMSVAVFSVVTTAMIATQDNYDVLVPLLLFGVLVYLLIEVAVNRGFKRLYVGAIRYVITVMAVLVLFYLMRSTGMFGMVAFVPATNDVKSVTLTMERPDCFAGSADGSYNRYDLTMTLQDKAQIDAVRSVHETALARYKDSGTNAYDYYDLYANTDVWVDYYGGDEVCGGQIWDNRRTYVRFSYTMNIGLEIEREYTITDRMLLSLYEAVLTPENYSKVFYERGTACQGQWRLNDLDVSEEAFREIYDTYSKENEGLTLERLLCDVPDYIFNNVPLYKDLHAQTIHMLRAHAVLDTEPDTPADLSLSSHDLNGAILIAPDNTACWYKQGVTVQRAVQEADFLMTCCMATALSQFCDNVPLAFGVRQALLDENVKLLDADYTKDWCYSLYLPEEQQYLLLDPVCNVELYRIYENAAQLTTEEYEIALNTGMLYGTDEFKLYQYVDYSAAAAEDRTLPSEESFWKIYNTIYDKNATPVQ